MDAIGHDREITLGGGSPTRHPCCWHIALAVIDGYVDIGILDAVVPFAPDHLMVRGARSRHPPRNPSARAR